MTKAQGAQSIAGQHSPEEQTELVQQFCRGDRSAFAALVRVWEQRLLTIAYRVVGNLHDAEEVRQNVLLKLAQSANQIHDPSHFAGWLRRCVVNEAITLLRRRGPGLKRTESLDDTVAHESLSPAQEAIAAERSRLLHEAMCQLDPDSRALLSLRFDECLTIRQIAEVVEKPPMTVHSQISRAVEQLRRLLAPELR